MKYSIFLILFFSFSMLKAQNENATDVLVIAHNDSVMTLKEANKFHIKEMQRYVSNEKRQELVNKFGADVIGANQKIVLVEFYTDEEYEKHRQEVTDLLNNPKSQFKIKEGEQAIDFTVQTVNGETISLAELKGKVVFISFWATWCLPCLKELNEIPEYILKPYGKHKDFVYLPIAIGEPKEVVAIRLKQLAEKGVLSDSGYDEHKEIWDLYSGKNIPASMVIDQNGVVRYTVTGYNEKYMKQISKTIKKLLRK